MSESLINAKVFDRYARYYDLLYREKAYADEVMFISDLLRSNDYTGKTLLELGCGTGRHAVEFAKLDWGPSGIDLSDEMVNRAQQRMEHNTACHAQGSTFVRGDVRNARLNKKYNAVVSLFHVASYQQTNRDMLEMIETAAVHLNAGGKFFFDFWYGPAVLSDPPVVRVKRLADDRMHVTRIAEPEMRSSMNQVVVNYQILMNEHGDNRFEDVRESHLMRYWFLPELSSLLEAGAFKMLSSGRCYTHQDLGPDSWYGWVLAEKL